MAWRGALLVAGDFEKAEALARTALDIRREHFPETHRLVGELKNTLGSALTGSGKYDEAEVWLNDAYTSFLAEFGESHRGVSLAAFNLAELYKAKGEIALETEWRETEARALAAEKASLAQ